MFESYIKKLFSESRKNTKATITYMDIRKPKQRVHSNFDPNFPDRVDIMSKYTGMTGY